MSSGNISLSRCRVIVVYLKLENITRKFQHPCVMDIKIGPITYDHEADAAKIAREKAKSPSLPEVGFQILGVRVSDMILSSRCCFEKPIKQWFLWLWVAVAGFELDGNARVPFPFFFIQRERRSCCFFYILQLLTVIFRGSHSVIKLIRLLP